VPKQRAWRDAGSPDPYRPGNIVDNTTRYMGIELLFHPHKNQKTTLFVACIYAPYSEMETNHPGIIRKFYKTVENHLLHLPSTTTPILGGDFNASIGVPPPPPADHDPVIGPYAFCIQMLLVRLTDMARNCSLQASATYFKHRSYETFYDLQNNCAPRQLDLIFVHQKHGMHVTDAGVFQPRNNVVSDHHATRLKLRLVRNLSKNKNKHVSTQDASALVEDPINWSLLHRDKLKRQEFADHIETILFEYTACEPH
jgi:exonuclease III